MHGDLTEMTAGLRRATLVALLGSFTAFGSLSVDVYLPGLPALGHDFHASASATQLTLSAFLVGFAVGQLTGGSVSDRLGRRRPVLVALGAYAILTVSCALAPSLVLLYVARCIQGVTAGVIVGVARAIVRDVHHGTEAARLFSLLMMILGVAPIVGPVLGGQILRVTSWRGVFIAMAILVVVLLLVTITALPETLAVSQRRSTGAEAWLSAVKTLIFDRIFVGYLVAGAVAVGGIFAWVGGSAFVLQGHFRLTPQAYAIVFSVQACGVIIGGQLNRRLVRRIAVRRLLFLGLLLQFLGAAVVLGLFLSAQLGIAPVIPAMLVVFVGVGMIVPNTLTLALEEHATEAGVAAGLIGIVQYGLGAAIAPLMGVAGNESGAPIGVALLSCAVVGFLSYGVIARQRYYPEVQVLREHL